MIQLGLTQVYKVFLLFLELELECNKSKVLFSVKLHLKMLPTQKIQLPMFLGLINFESIS